MTVPLMKVHLEVDCVVPHDLAMLTQGQVVEAIAQAVVNGQLAAKLEIELASPDVSLREVSPVIKQMWLARLSVDSLRMSQARAQLAAITGDDTGQLEEAFLVWDRGEAIVDVKAWFKEQK